MTKLVKEASLKNEPTRRKIVVEHNKDMQIFNILYYEKDKLLTDKSRTSYAATLKFSDLDWLEGK